MTYKEFNTKNEYYNWLSGSKIPCETIALIKDIKQVIFRSNNINGYDTIYNSTLDDYLDGESCYISAIYDVDNINHPMTGKPGLPLMTTAFQDINPFKKVLINGVDKTSECIKENIRNDIKTYGASYTFTQTGIYKIDFIFDDKLLKQCPTFMDNASTNQVKISKAKFVINTPNILSAQRMFYYCKIKDIDLSNFNCLTSSLNFAFYGMTNITELDITGLNTSMNESVQCMFSESNKLENIYGIQNLDVSNCNNFTAMFYNCSKLNNIDISRWDTSKATNMNAMFAGCTLLNNLDIPEIPINCDTTSIASIFSGCTSLSNIKSCKTISSSVSFSDSPLTRESAIKVINALNPEVVGTLTLKASTKELLTDEDELIATNKGWQIL